MAAYQAWNKFLHLTLGPQKSAEVTSGTGLECGPWHGHHGPWPWKRGQCRGVSPSLWEDRGQDGSTHSREAAPVCLSFLEGGGKYICPGAQKFFQRPLRFRVGVPVLRFGAGGALFGDGPQSAPSSSCPGDSSDLAGMPSRGEAVSVTGAAVGRPYSPCGGSRPLGRAGRRGSSAATTSVSRSRPCRRV